VSRSTLCLMTPLTTLGDGTVVARYGGEDCVAVDVRMADGQYRLFWPRDLEENSPQGTVALPVRWGWWVITRALTHPGA
jgi:hypothetical protein